MEYMPVCRYQEEILNSLAGNYMDLVGICRIQLNIETIWLNCLKFHHPEVFALFKKLSYCFIAHVRSGTDLFVHVR